MELYQPCNNIVDPANPINPINPVDPFNPNDPSLPNQDYWNGQIFPDCCVYECSVECFPAPEPPEPPKPTTTTTEAPPINKCPYVIPGWSIINDKRIYLGSSEAQLSWFAAEAKAIEVGGHLLEIYSNE